MFRVLLWGPYIDSRGVVVVCLDRKQLKYCSVLTMLTLLPVSCFLIDVDRACLQAGRILLFHAVDSGGAFRAGHAGGADRVPGGLPAGAGSRRADGRRHD